MAEQSCNEKLQNNSEQKQGCPAMLPQKSENQNKHENVSTLKQKQHEIQSQKKVTNLIPKAPTAVDSSLAQTLRTNKHDPATLSQTTLALSQKGYVVPPMPKKHEIEQQCSVTTLTTKATSSIFPASPPKLVLLDSKFTKDKRTKA